MKKNGPEIDKLVKWKVGCAMLCYLNLLYSLLS